MKMSFFSNLFGFNDSSSNASKSGKRLRLRFVNNHQTFFKGDVGTSTPYVDSLGTPLYVGDKVLVTSKDNKKYTSENFIIHTKNMGHQPDHIKHFFTVMGYGIYSTDHKNILGDEYIVTLTASHSSLTHGDRIDMIHAIMVDNELYPEWDYKRPLPDRPARKDMHIIHNYNISQSFGEVGKPTAYNDCYGSVLFTGDVVKVYDLDNKLVHQGFIGEIETHEKYRPKERKVKFAIVGFDSDYWQLYDCKKYRIERTRKFEDISHENFDGYSMAYVKTQIPPAFIPRNDKTWKQILTERYNISFD